MQNEIFVFCRESAAHKSAFYLFLQIHFILCCGLRAFGIVPDVFRKSPKGRAGLHFGFNLVPEQVHNSELICG